MVTYDDESLFLTEGVGKQITITYSGGTLTNSDLIEDDFTIEESLCSEDELRFGACESSCLRFRIGYGTTSMIGKELTVSILPDGASESLQIGVFKVYSDTPTADRRWRDIVAYDAMYEILNSDVADWYNTILPDSETTVTLAAFRASFFSHFGITEESVTLPNDNMTVEQTISPSSLSGMNVIRAICEINGCFGHINRDGIFEYIFLDAITEGLYPSETLYPAEDLYPEDPLANKIGIGGTYLTATYEDYETAAITKLQVRQEENDVGAIIGSGSNCYIIEDNFLVYGKDATDLEDIAQNIYDEICEVAYRPMQIEAVGNPCLEVGDSIIASTSYLIISSYIMRRTLKGIQALYDIYESSGSEYQPEQVNSLNKEIIQLKGKTNTLERNVEETIATISDVESGLQSQITQNANAITAEVTRATGAENTLSSSITANANAITAEVTRATGAEGNLSSRITANADSITAEVTRATGVEGTLSSNITANANAITAEVTRATGVEGTLSSNITANATAITTKVTKGDVSSEISQEAGQISISSNRLVISSDNFSLAADGTITATNATLSGKITATDGEIGGFTITSDSIYSGASTFGGSGIYLGSSGFSIGGNYGSLEIDSNGKMEFETGSNPVKIIAKNYSNLYSTLDYDGIKVYGNASVYTVLNFYQLKITSGTYYSSTLDSQELTIQGSSTTKAVYTYNKITATGQGSTGYTISSNSNMSIEVGAYYELSLEGGTIVVGDSISHKVAFFGGSGVARQSVGNLTDSPTVDNLKTKLNSLIDALQAYNLIG